MESIETKKGMKGFYCFTWVALIIAALMLVCTIFVLSQLGLIYGAAPGFGDIMITLYNMHALLVALFVLLLIGLLAAKIRRELWVKVMTWGMLLLAVALSTPIFTQVLSILPQAEALAGVTTICAYAPVLCVTVTLVALLAQWDSANKKAVHTVSLICWIAAAATTAVYLVQNIRQYAVGGYELSGFDYAYLIAEIAGDIAIVLICVFAWMVTSSRRKFDRVIYAMTDEEAAVMEGVEDRIEEIADDLEEEILAGITAQKAEESGEKATVKEAEEVLLEDVQEIEEAQKEPLGEDGQK